MIVVAGSSYIHKRIWYYMREVFSEKQRIVVVDGANMFDPYLISEISVKMSLNPYEVLENIFIARAFTPFQMLELLKRSVRLYYQNKKFIFVFIGLTTLLDDDNISNIHARKILNQSIGYLNKIIKPIVTVNDFDRRNMHSVLEKEATVFIKDNSILKPMHFKKGADKLWAGQLHLLHTL